MSSWGFGVGCALGLVAACSPNGNGTSSSNLTASGGSGAVAATGGSANTGTGGSVSTGGSINPGTGGGIDVPDAGGDETCIRIGLLGRRPSYGAMPGMDNTDALQAWLNAHVKAGTTISVVPVEQELTADFLAGFEVVILQALEQQEGGPYWTFSQAELDAFHTWISAGGGAIALTGYGAQATEVAPTNQLLAFSGISFNTEDVFGTCPDNCCYCAGSSTIIRMSARFI